MTILFIRHVFCREVEIICLALMFFVLLSLCAFDRMYVSCTIDNLVSYGFCVYVPYLIANLINYRDVIGP